MSQLICASMVASDHIHFHYDSFKGIFWGMMIGLAVGVIRMVLDMIMSPPNCGSGQPDERMSIVVRVDFLHFSIINAIICLIAMVVISLFTRPRTHEQVSKWYGELTSTFNYIVQYHYKVCLVLYMTILSIIAKYL